MKIIKTERLFLRNLEVNDWQAVNEYASDPEVVRYMDWGPNTEKETKDFIQRAMSTQEEKPRRVYSLAIVVEKEDRLIGSCGINVSNPENREGWLGYCLDRNFWGKGYGTEVARGLMDFGFTELALHRIFDRCE